MYGVMEMKARYFIAHIVEKMRYHAADVRVLESYAN